MLPKYTSTPKKQVPCLAGPNSLTKVKQVEAQTSRMQCTRPCQSTRNRHRGHGCSSIQ